MKKILLAAGTLLSLTFASGAFAGDCGNYGYSTFAPGGCYSNRILIKQECAPVVVEQPACPAPCPPVVACPQPVVVCQPQPIQYTTYYTVPACQTYYVKPACCSTYVAPSCYTYYSGCVR